MSRSATPATRNEATRRLKPPKMTSSAELTIGTAIRGSYARSIKDDQRYGGRMVLLFSYGYWSKPWYLVNPKIAGKWMFIPLKLIIIGFDPHPYGILCSHMKPTHFRMIVLPRKKTSFLMVKTTMFDGLLMVKPSSLIVGQTLNFDHQTTILILMVKSIC